MFIMRIGCQTSTGRCHRSCSVPFNGKGALLPSVAGSGALQPCVRRWKQSIIMVGNKHQLPAKSWSASSVAGSFSYSAKLFGSRNVEIVLPSKHNISGKKKKLKQHPKKVTRIFGIHKVLCLVDHEFLTKLWYICDRLVLTGSRSCQVTSGFQHWFEYYIQQLVLCLDVGWLWASLKKIYSLPESTFLPFLWQFCLNLWT